MDINIDTLGSIYGDYLRSSESTSLAYSMEVFYDLFDGAVTREVLERTRSGLCLQIVEDFIWAGLMSLKA